MVRTHQHFIVTVCGWGRLHGPVALLHQHLLLPLPLGRVEDPDAQARTELHEAQTLSPARASGAQLAEAEMQPQWGPGCQLHELQAPCNAHSCMQDPASIFSNQDCRNCVS